MALDLPPELTTVPLQLIAVTGLDIGNNETHKAIWNSLTVQRRSDRLALCFKLITADYAFPTCQVKRSNYDGYVPQGIFKLNWARKHLNDLPAVVVLFVDLDWNHPNWNEKATECQSKVESLRHSLEGRNTRLAVVLVQSGQQMPPGEDVLAAERATQLCTQSDISPKSLFVLPAHTNHQFGYILRLEQAFHELAATYYTAEIRRIKAKKESLSKSTHQALLVRCQIKLSLMNELKQDSHTALRHSKLAYQHLIEMNMTDVNYHEWKAVAALLNFNICRLCFTHNVPLDAIGHFKRHIEFYSNRVGSRPDPVVAQFEHEAWMSRQYSMFGEQFDKAVQAGLAAIQTQHPGFYYQSAAQHAQKRRDMVDNVTQELRAIGAVYPEQNDPLAMSNQLCYLGQRAWRLGLSSDHEVDEHIEASAALALKIRESQLDLCTVVISLLNAASAQFKRYRCPRMRRHVSVKLAAEHVKQQQLQNALKMYMHVLWEYRSERWWGLVYDVCQPLLAVSYTLASLNEYIAVCMQIMNPIICPDPVNRMRVAANLAKVLAGSAPDAEPSCTNPQLAAQNWSRVLCERSFFMVQMQPIFGALLARADFLGVTGKTNKSISLDKPLKVRVLLHSMCQVPICFRKLSVKFGVRRAPVHTFEASDCLPPVCCDDAARLHIQSGNTLQFVFDVPLSGQHINTDVAITAICLDVGNLQSPVCGSFHWDDCAGAVPADAIRVEYASVAGGALRSRVQACTTDPTQWTSSTDSVVAIERRRASAELTVTGSSDLVMADTRVMQVRLNNTESVPITNVRLCMTTRAKSTTEDSPSPQPPPPQQQQPTGVSPLNVLTDGKLDGLVLSTKSQDQWVHSLDIQCADLPPQQFACLPVNCVSNQPGEFVVDCQLTYNVQQVVDGRQVECECVQTASQNIVVQQAFTVQTNLTTLAGEPVDLVICNESVLLYVVLSASRDTAVHIASVEWMMAPQVTLDPSTPAVQYVNAKLEPNDRYSVVALIEFASPSADVVSFGNIKINWNRCNTDSIDDRKAVPDPTTALSLVASLPQQIIRQCPVLVSLSSDGIARVRQPLHCVYHVRNVGSSPIRLTLTLNTPDSLMFSGRKQTEVRLLPGDRRPLAYVFFPLTPGFIRWPTFTFAVLDQQQEQAVPIQDTINLLAQRSLQPFIFVLVRTASRIQ